MRRIVLVMACVGALLVAGSSAAWAGPHGNHGNHGYHGGHGHHANYGNYNYGYRPYASGYRYGARYIAPYPAYGVAPYAAAPYPAYGYGPQQYGFSYASPGFSLFQGR